MIRSHLLENSPLRLGAGGEVRGKMGIDQKPWQRPVPSNRTVQRRSDHGEEGGADVRSEMSRRQAQGKLAEIDRSSAPGQSTIERFVS